MPQNVLRNTNQLWRYSNKIWWQGWEEFSEHANAIAFAKFCRSNGASARAIKLTESRQWHGALARTVVYIPRDRSPE